MTVRVLVLGGTIEAREVASAAVAAGHDVVTSLAGRTARPRVPDGERRTGGFGGPAGLVGYLASQAVDAVVVATHPFATRIAAAAARACADAGVPVIALCRPPWSPQAGDRWHRVPDLGAAAAAARDLGTRALLTTGRQGLAAFADVDAVWFLIRCVEQPVGPLPPRSQVLRARGPFAVAGELALLREHAIDVLVTKDSGGVATAAKLDAARALDLPVVVVDRPPGPDLPAVADATGALAWLEGQRSDGAPGR